jgi:septal ring factor EnvC (AmiA/AmiB activator)
MRKIIIIAVSVLCLCFSVVSCYPELSVQQYDKLKEDISLLNEQTETLKTELEEVTAALNTIKEKNSEVRQYLDFMVQLISTQSSEGLLAGEFDVIALANAKDALVTAAGILQDSDISYYVSLIDAEKEAETVGAYYKAIEYCLKNIRQKLAVNGTNGNTQP